jgi:hypothetical protein
MIYFQGGEAPNSAVCDFCGAEDSSLHFFLVCPALVRPRTALLQVVRTNWPSVALLQVFTCKADRQSVGLLQEVRTGWPPYSPLLVTVQSRFSS